ncbi:MAG: site-2 protease family protein [Microscillaceae bacterium]
MHFRRYGLHLFLFVLTLLTTTLAGAEWRNGALMWVDENGWHAGNWFSMQEFWEGFQFSIPFLLFLTCHEFGHYFTAQWHGIRATLPFYLPLWLGFTFTIGTIGAVIQLRDSPRTRTQYFDIGIAGPLAGFVVALGILYYGFTHLPPPNYVLEINPEYKTLYPKEYARYGADYARYAYRYPDTEENRRLKRVGQPREDLLAVGKSLIFIFFEQYIVPEAERYKIPTAYEIFHYPCLFAGFLALLFTALNLVPIGQLDGGHILYGLIGQEGHRRVAPVLFAGFIFYAGLGMVSPQLPLDTLLYALPLQVLLYYFIFYRTLDQASGRLALALGVLAAQMLISFIWPGAEGYSGWLAFGFLLGRFLGVYHPAARYDRPLGWPRQVLGWLALLIFVLSFSPQPIVGA